MDHPYQNTMHLPAAYAVISEEEMTYLDGGQEIVLAEAFGYQLTLDPEQLAAFCFNVAVNFVGVFTNMSFSYVFGLYQSGINSGLSPVGTVYHTWGKLNTGWSKAAAIGITGLAGVYVYTQAVSIIQSVKSLYDAIFNPMPTFDTAQAAA